MNRQDWAVARETIRRQERTCDEKGHMVRRVGPYRICRTLTCPVVVVGLVA
jgi:hypothetical protein